MKLVDQYLVAIGELLSYKTRRDITEELRALLLDQIEETYGPEPNDDQIKEAIAGFGSPDTVAKKYQGERHLIAPSFTDLYFLTISIMAGAMAIAFTVVFIVEYAQGLVADGDVVSRILAIPVNAFNTWLAGIGAVTLVFIVMTRYFPTVAKSIGDKWSVEALSSIPLPKNAFHVSRIETVISVTLLCLLIVLINGYPEIITTVETLFSRTDIPLGHRINIDAFRLYGVLLSILWVATIITYLLMLHKGTKVPYFIIAETIISAAGMILAAVMLLDKGLYIKDTGWIGFRVIFLILLVVNTAETGSALFKQIKSKLIHQS